MEKLESITINKFKWFLNDVVRANPKKYHGLSSLNMSTKASVNNFDIENNTNSQKLLKITIDWKLRFLDQFSNQYKKASAKIVTMVKVSTFMLLIQRKLIMSYCYVPIWLLPAGFNESN